jgi:hypothetical protein
MSLYSLVNQGIYGDVAGLPLGGQYIPRLHITEEYIAVIFLSAEEYKSTEECVLFSCSVHQQSSLHKIALLASRTLSLPRALLQPKKQFLLANTP